MSVDVVTEIVIDRACALVAAFAADPTNAPSWYANIESVEWRTAPPLALGSQMVFVARFLGRRLEYTYEVVDLAVGERLVMRTAEGPFPMETSYSWHGLDAERTKMTLRNRGEPKGFASIAAAPLRAAMRRANRADLERLKALLESS